MKLNEYQKHTSRTSPEIDNVVGCLINFSMGLSGESGEVTDHIKKVAFQGHELDTENIAKELGDIMWYVARSADAIGYDLETIAKMNIDKLKKRYPGGFSEEASVNRSE
jgi:NTP pyrophosphatase (non-canonical NTP hydrolase)